MVRIARCEVIMKRPPSIPLHSGSRLWLVGEKLRAMRVTFKEEPTEVKCDDACVLHHTTPRYTSRLVQGGTTVQASWVDVYSL
jgi:hypothetical protein